MAEISGLIIDCDGTILDSMYLWGRVWDEVVSRYGKVIDPATDKAMADAHLASKCMRVLNQHVGCVPSDDDFVEIVYDHVYSYYKDKVDAFPGAREFMEEVAASGIPYVMATGTRRREVRAALDANGLSEFFPDEKLLSCEDLGVGKKNPAVYELASSKLGAPRATTWVFEDEVEGLRTAAREGYRTVCMYNDHDGLDAESQAAVCDIFARGFGEISLAKIRAWEGTAHE